MTMALRLLSPELMRGIALSLLHFLWQGAAIAALAYAALALCRSASARYVAAVFAMALMLAVPVVTGVILSSGASQNPMGAGPASAVTASGATPALTRECCALSVREQAAASRLAAFSAMAASFAGRSLSPAVYLALLEIWFAGVLLLSLRSLGGFVVLERLRRRESSVPVPDEILELCLELQDRLHFGRFIRYCKSAGLDAPAVAGWLRPVVLLPVSAISGLTREQIEAVIAHELAHIRRHDALVNLLQVGVETLLFYHPAVWWLGKRIREERENCCDDAAVAVCGSAVTYAHALTRMAESRRAPRLAMAANRGPLAARVARLLGMAGEGERTRSASLSAGILWLSAALVAGSALMGIARAARAQSPDAPSAPAPAAAPAPPADFDAAFIITAPAPQLRRARAPIGRTPAVPASAPRALAIPRVVASPAQNPALSAPVVIPAPAAAAPAPKAPVARLWAWAFPAPAPAAPGWTSGQSGNASQTPQPSYIDSMKAAGLENLSVDDLIALKVQGVTADYVKQMRSLGFQTDAGSIIGMKAQGVTPEYVKQMRDLGFKGDSETIIGMKVQGVTPEYVKQMHDLGLATDGESLIGMKAQGITPEYVKQMNDLGLKLDSDDLIGMKAQGVTPAYINAMRGFGLKADASDIIGMKAQGVTPEYVKSFEEMGLHPDADEIIGMKAQGVTVDYMKKMEATGFRLGVDDAIGAKAQGITPEFIEKVRSHGFKNLTFEQLMALKHAGVLDPQ